MPALNSVRPMLGETHNPLVKNSKGTSLVVSALTLARPRGRRFGMRKRDASSTRRPFPPPPATQPAPATAPSVSAFEKTNDTVARMQGYPF